MTVDIWSDIRCPFCYIGKKNFEKGLTDAGLLEKVKVVWHSFQLDPSLKTSPEKNSLEHFMESKGISRDRAEEMFSHVQSAAETAGIHFNMEGQKVANSYRGHLLIHLAQARGLGSEAEELLFRAQFVENRNIDDTITLMEIGKTLGLEEKEISEALTSDALGYAVMQDMQQAQQLGISGVPFFVINDKYGVSGAQPPEVFAEVLEKSWQEFSAGEKGLNILNSTGDSCDTEGNCD